MTPIKIGFIFPSSAYLADPFRGDPFTHLHILTILESYFDHKVDLSLIDLRGIQKEFAIYHIDECDLYLHSIYTLDYHDQVDTVNSLRIRYPKAKHIAGGPHANEFAEECLKTFDSLILGEGEESVIQAIKDFMNLDLKKIYPQKAPIDINQYPYSQRKYLPKTAVARKNVVTLKHQKGYDQFIGTTVLFSRGCPYNCHFCALQQIKKKTPGIRHRHPHLVEAEIEYLKQTYGIQGLNLTDEIAFPLNETKAIHFLEAMGKTGVVWRAQCRADGITPPLAKLARECGCRAIGMGIESVSQQSLEMINKKIDIQKAKETIRFLNQSDIEVRLYMIIGLPGEPEDIVEQTWAFIQETEPSLVYLSLFTIRPGTKVYNQPEKFGIKEVKSDWRKTMHMYGRYKNEIPTLSFEYHDQTPWGKGMASQKIIQNYLELQSRLQKHGLCSLMPNSSN